MLSNVNFAHLDTYLNKALYYYDLPGLPFTWNRRSRLFLFSGLAKRPDEILLQRNHIFHMASVTKSLYQHPFCSFKKVC